MRSSVRFKLIYLIILTLIHFFILSFNISFAAENETIQSNEIITENKTTTNNETVKEDTTIEKNDITIEENNHVLEDGIYIIRSSLNEKIGLDVSQGSSANFANIQLYEYMGEDQQKFEVKYTSDGYYKITVLRSKKAIEVAKGGQAPATNVWQNESNNSDEQKWIIKQTGDGFYNIISKCNSLYLNVSYGNGKNGSNIEVYTKNESNAQKFKFEKVKNIQGKKTISDGIYEIRTKLNEKYVLDVSQALKTNGANIQLYQYFKENQQKFKVKYSGNGYYTITALHSGKALDVAGAGKRARTNVWQHELNNTDAQKWIIIETEDGYYNIISKCNSLYLDVANNTAKNTANIQVNIETGIDAQKFKFVKASEIHGQTLIGERTIKDGIYSIRTVLNEKYGLDVSVASKSNGANIQLYEYVDVNQQKFYVKYIGNGNYTLTALHSEKVLDVAGAGKKPGTNVWQHEKNNTDAQKWIISKNKDGSYNIISKCNELYLDVTDSIIKNETNIRVYTGNNANAQKFKFIEADISCEEGIYGKSGLLVKGDSRGTNLKYYKFGQGENVLFTTFSIHGFEDSYDHDGSELTYIAEQFKEHLTKTSDYQMYKNWTIYILPTLNPDGQTYGTTNNGEGRTTLYSAAPNNKGIDMNRNFQAAGQNYKKYTDNRNYNGTEAFQAYEARYLREFLLSRKSVKGQTILVDLHGWLNETMGDNGLGEFYRNKFGMEKHISTYGQGYLINWARMSLGNSNKTARSVIVELPKVNSHEELVSNKHAEKYIDATIKMLKSIV